MKIWKLLGAAVLVVSAVSVNPKPVAASCSGDACWYVCQYFYPDSYCYYDDCCTPHCCAWNDPWCVNPCSP
jgi:hypothetical protein